MRGSCFAFDFFGNKNEKNENLFENYMNGTDYIIRKFARKRALMVL